MSIRLRLAALFTLATVVLVSAGAYVYLRQLRSSLESSLDQGLTARVGTIAAALSSDPSTRLTNGTDGYVQIFDSSGSVLRGSAALRGDRLLTVAEVARAARAPVHADRSVPLHTVDDPGVEPMRVYAAPGGARGDVIAVAARRDLVDDAVQQSRNQLVILGIIVIVLAAPGSWLLARAALRPVDRMRAQVARLGSADIGSGVPVPGTRDEIARLGRTFNILLARLQSALERERSFTADAGHELRTPLTVLKGEFELARRPGRSRGELLETVDIAADETERLIRLTENLLVLAREGGPAPQRSLDLPDLARESAAAAEGAAAAKNVRIVIDGADVGVVRGDADRLRQALDNLLGNAIRHSPDGGRVMIRLRRHDTSAEIEVADGGAGFPPGFLPRAFERFARADEARTRGDTGNGLGLAIVAEIMRSHGGAAVAANLAAGGAVVTVRWPQPDDDGPGTDV